MAMDNRVTSGRFAGRFSSGARTESDAWDMKWVSNESRSDGSDAGGSWYTSERHLAWSVCAAKN